MSITGAHILLYSPEADAVRRILRDVFDWQHVDAGDGWLIFALPPAEIAVHPGDQPAHQLTLMCDNLTETISELEARGVDFSGSIADEGWGLITMMHLPGGVEVMLYEPRHSTPR